MASECGEWIRAERNGGILRITIDRPEKKNAMTPEMGEAMIDLVERSAGDPEVAVIVLGGAGGCYTSGADVTIALPARAQSPLRRHVRGQPLMRLLSVVARSSVPVVSSVSGWALGAGTGLVGASTFAVAGRSAVFGMPEVRLGVFPAAVMPVIVDRVGPHRAMRWALTGVRISATEAHDSGLVDILVPDDELGHTVDELAETIVSNGSLVNRAGMEWFRKVNAGLGELVDYSNMLSHLYAAGTEADITGEPLPNR
ncbi:enoyl-CoA hydratase/isomerase family protein [Actinophytocola sp.]|uniref:enoyl-CoA hydratase/isomerase family protein n=1 Tax=Actinophytocola sp. TaxID=1872138 RepID=UPI003D6AB036